MWNRISSAYPPLSTQPSRPGWDRSNMRARSRSKATCRRRRCRSTLSRRARSLSRASSAVRNAPAVAYWRGTAIRYLLQNSVDPLSCSSADPRGLELPSHDQTAPQRLVDGLDLQLQSDRGLRNDVDDRTERRGHAHAVDRLDVAFGEPRVVQAE